MDAADEYYTDSKRRNTFKTMVYFMKFNVILGKLLSYHTPIVNKVGSEHLYYQTFLFESAPDLQRLQKRYTG